MLISANFRNINSEILYIVKKKKFYILLVA